MSWLWLKNLLGVRLSDEQLADISHPHVELYTHVTIKTVQTGAMFGTLLVGPLVAALRVDTRNTAGFQSAAVKYGSWGAVLGSLAGPLMTYAAVRSKSGSESVYDDSYRLRLNGCQVRVDRASLIGALSGTSLAAAVAAARGGGGANADDRESTTWRLGALVGMSTGVILMSLCNTVSK